MTSTQTDRYGFPIITCTRCAGSGHYSYNAITGTRCFKCNGTGVVHTPAAAKAYHAFVEARRQATRPTLADLAVGDEIRTQVSMTGKSSGEWRTVATITDTGEAMGWSRHDFHDGECGSTVHPEHWTVMATRLVVTFTDGTEVRYAGNTLVARKATVDPEPYLAQV